MRQHLLTAFLSIFSRQLFYRFFYYTNKLCLYGMNRITANTLEPELSGEKQAAAWVLNQLDPQEKLTIFDCGASFGSYTQMLLSILQGREVTIHLFEPASRCVAKLFALFGSMESIQIHKLAISNQTGATDLYSPWWGAPGASLSKQVLATQHTEHFKLRSEPVMSVTLDEFCDHHHIDRIDLLKLDIEGYEALALEGASRLLQEKRIRSIQVEIGSASLGTKCLLFDIWNLLHESYSFYLILKHDLVRIDRYSPDLECFIGASNFLLVSKEE